MALSKNYFVVLTFERDAKLPNIFPITKFKQLEFSHIKQKISEISIAKKEIKEKIQLKQLIKPEISREDFRELISFDKKSESLFQSQSQIYKRNRKSTELLDKSKNIINSLDQEILTDRVTIVHHKMKGSNNNFYEFI